MELEILSCNPSTGTEIKTTPLLFVHGAWCWQENFLPYFARHGYLSVALSLRGHGQSEGREKLRWTKLTDFVGDVAEVASKLPSPPIIIAHSMGGLVAQHFIQGYRAKGIILLASVPPKGALGATLRYARRHPLVYARCCLSLSLYPMVASCGLVKDTLFSNKVSAEKVEDYASLVQDEAFRGYLDMIFNLPKLKNSPQMPFLVLGAANDRIISPREVMATGEVYHAPVHIFEEGGHDMMLDQGWQAVADRMLEWLVEQDFN